MPPPLPPVEDLCEGKSWTEFFQEHGRVPMIQDERKPWTYRGWLMWYRTLAEDHLDIPPRWKYWFATMDQQKILDAPIPRIDFEHHPGEGSDGFKMMDKCVRLVDQTEGGWPSVGRVLEWLMFGLGMSKEQPKFRDERTNEALYREFNLQPWLEKPADYIGEWIAMQRGGWNPGGFYPTPHSLVEMMTQMTMGEGDHRCETVQDCAVGAGRMLLHASNHSLRLYGQDIDQTVLMGCHVNAALFAPWMARPFPDQWFDDFKLRKENSCQKALPQPQLKPSRNSKRKPSIPPAVPSVNVPSVTVATTDSPSG